MVAVHAAPAPTRADPVRDLMALDDMDFESLVDSDTRDELGEPFRSALRDPRVAKRWRRALGMLKGEIEAGFVEKAAELNELKAKTRNWNDPSAQRKYLARKAQVDRWRSETLTQKALVERRIAESKTLIAAQNAAGAKRDTMARMVIYRAALRRIAQTDEDVSPEDLIDIARDALDRTGDGWDDPRGADLDD